MFSKEILEKEFQILAKQYSIKDWTLLYDRQFNVAEMVSPLMIEEEAYELENQLIPLIPIPLWIVKSRKPEGIYTHRLLIKLEHIQESAYINCFLRDIRLFPHTFWIPYNQNNQKFLKTCYPMEYAKYYLLLIKALGEFAKGTIDCFSFSYSKNGELEVVGDLQVINETINAHKLQCHSIIKKYVSKIEGVFDVLQYATNQSFLIYYHNLVVKCNKDNGLPAITFKVKDTETYEQAIKCFPNFLEVMPNSYTKPMGDPNHGRKIGVRITSPQDMCSMINRKLHRQIHEAREKFCQLLWALKIKSNLSFFPSEIRYIINKDICPEIAYLTDEEILHTINKIEKSSLDSVESPIISNGLS